MNKFLGLFALLFVKEAYALDADYGNDSVDLGYAVLQSLFGGSPNFGLGQDSFQDIFLPIGLLCTTATLFLLIVNIVGRLLRGAATGEMFQGSERVTSPLRILAGIFLPMPIFNGYSPILILILYIASMANGAASGLQHRITSSDMFARTLAASPVQPEAKRLAKSVLLMSLCMRAYEYQARRDGRLVQTMGWSTGFGESKNIFWGKPLEMSHLVEPGQNSLVEMLRQDKSRDIVLRAGDPYNSNEIKHDSCGYIKMESFYEAKTSWKDYGMIAGEKAIEAGSGAYLGNKLSKLSEEGSGTSYFFNAAGLVNAIDSMITGVYDVKSRQEWAERTAYGHAMALEELLLRADEISHAIYAKAENKDARKNKELVKNLQNPDATYNLWMEEYVEPMGVDEIITAIDGLASNYQNTLRQQAGIGKDGGEKYQKLVQDSQKYGWLPAGLMFSQMATISDGMNKMSMEMPSAQAVTTAAETRLNNKFNSRYMSKINEYFLQTNNYRDDGSVVAISDKDLRGTREGDDRQQKSSGVFGGIGQWISDFSVQMIVEPDTHPFLLMQKWGRISIISGGALTTYNAAQLIGEKQADDYSQIALSILTKSLFWTMGNGMIVIGMLLCYVVPLVPSLIWLGGVLGCYLTLIQIMLVANPWAATFALPGRSDDFLGAQRQTAISMFLGAWHPLFLTVGFYGMYIVIAVFGQLFSMLFVFMYKSSTLSDGSGLILNIVNAFILPFVYLILIYIICMRGARFMVDLADKTARMLGAGTSIGETAESMGSSFERSMASVSNAASAPARTIRNDLAEINQIRKSFKGASAAPLSGEVLDSEPNISGGLPNNGDGGEVIDMPPPEPNKPNGGGDAGSYIGLPPASTQSGDGESGIGGSPAAPPSAPQPTLGRSVGGASRGSVNRGSSPVGRINWATGEEAPINNPRPSDWAGHPDFNMVDGSGGVFMDLNIPTPQRESIAAAVSEQYSKAPLDKIDGQMVLAAAYNQQAVEQITGNKEYGQLAANITECMYQQASFDDDVAQIDHAAMIANTQGLNQAIQDSGDVNALFERTNELNKQGLHEFFAFRQAAAEMNKNNIL